MTERIAKFEETEAFALFDSGSDRQFVDNNTAEGFIDNGLVDNPATTDAPHQGKFKVPRLRNVAVTEPYLSDRDFVLRSVQ
ncbi:MAG: hypothetical protein JAY90_22180 [Candidatus Thiodiazotropha lotti]|nr:hypothetical protein [Candidatus Thiodiazotropha lotti]